MVISVAPDDLMAQIKLFPTIEEVKAHIRISGMLMGRKAGNRGEEARQVQGKYMTVSNAVSDGRETAVDGDCEPEELPSIGGATMSAIVELMDAQRSKGPMLRTKSDILRDS